MKLLFCFLSYVSPELRLAGGTTHFVQNLKSWRKSRDEILVLTTDDGAHLLNRLSIGCTIESVASGTAPLAKSNLGVSITLMIRALKILLRFKPLALQIDTEAICTESHFLPDILTALLARRYCPRARLITYLHHIIPHPRQRRKYHALIPSILSWSAQALSLRLMRKFGFYILTFPTVGRQLLDLGFLDCKIRYISNGIDIESIGKIPEMKSKFDACFLGNALPRKGVLDLPQVWRHVCDFMPDAKLAIAGTGRVQDVAKLRKSFQDKRLGDNVRFLGYLSDTEKFATLKSSSVFLFPSYEEGWGIVISEAMACGLPVVAYDLPAYHTAFRRGIVKVPLGSISDFANATVMLLKNDVKRIQLGQEGKNQAIEYDLEKVAASELGLIKEICH